jgi:hypothetical protein
MPELNRKGILIEGDGQMKGKDEVRTYEKLTKEDLKEIEQYAKEELKRFLNKEKYKVYENKLIAICLCQGAAQHFVNGKTGIKDIDVWFFFEEDKDVKIPNFKNMRKSVSKKFTNIGEKRIDFLKKAIKEDIINKSESEKPEDILKSYLQNGNTSTSKHLAKKSVIGLFPTEIFGKIIWEK